MSRTLFENEDAAEDLPATTSVAAASDAPRAPILLPVALDQTYDYVVPDDVVVHPGQFVLVPFGPQQRIGIVWDHAVDAPAQPAKPVDPKKLKAIFTVLDVPALPLSALRFAEWMAKYTLAPLGMVARMFMGPQSLFEPLKPRFGVAIVPDAPWPPRMTPARQKALEISADGQVRPKSALAALAQCTTGVVDGLVKSGNLVEIALPERQPPHPTADFSVVAFDGAQLQAVEALRASVQAKAFTVSLLDGVTGSGKTEVYYEAVATALRQNRQSLILLPEIALTSQFMDRFKKRFGAQPVEWHSALSPTDRARNWRHVASGAARVIVGARSALFLPFSDLGLIVIDEEHDQGFKQDDRVHYQGRDMAVVRARLGEIPVVLASATPSIESHVNARTGRYRHLLLPSRFTGTDLPEITPIDLRRDQPDKGRWLAPKLVAAVQETLAKGQQSLLFLNRRGYAPLTLCRACGHRFECPQCTAWLVEHRFKGRLACHHCGFQVSLPEKCPSCAAPGTLAACGPGIERVAEEVAERFPAAKAVLLSSDLVPGLEEMRAIIKEIERGEAQIIIGTQIVAKGHHFPDLNTVGIVDGDLGLAQGADPRAGERTFQLLHQVTGRAGRAFARGRGFIQTHMPDHPVMAAIISGDREAFLDREIEMRQAAGLPPYGRLAAIVLSHKDRTVVESAARELSRRAPQSQQVVVLGPAEAPIAVVRQRFRFRLLVKAPRSFDLQGFMRLWFEGLPKWPSDLRISVDVDPYNFL